MHCNCSDTEKNITVVQHVGNWRKWTTFCIDDFGMHFLTNKLCILMEFHKIAFLIAKTDNKWPLVMVWYRAGNKPLPESRPCPNKIMIICLKHDFLWKETIKYQSWFNSLGPSDAIWRCRSGSTLAQVIACCLTAPSQHLNQCWLISSKVHWH